MIEASKLLKICLLSKQDDKNGRPDSLMEVFCSVYSPKALLIRWSAPPSLKKPFAALWHAPVPGVAVGLSQFRLSLLSLEGREAGTSRLILKLDRIRLLHLLIPGFPLAETRFDM